MLGALDEADVRIGLDQGNPSTHDLLVARWPMGWYVGDRSRSVPREPSSLGLAARDVPGQNDLECPLPERDWWRVATEGPQVIGNESVRLHHVPVQLLLEADQPRAEFSVLMTELSESLRER